MRRRVQNMIKTLTAYTYEIDDVELAVSEIMDQLDLDNSLLSHSVGIVSCYADFVETGVWKALCDRLPFDVVGATTIANATGGEMGDAMLTLMVLTSDTLEFAVGTSEPIAKEEEEPLAAMYAQAEGKLSQKPALMLSFLPLLNNFGSDFYAEKMTEISGGVPDFGTVTVDHNADYHAATVLYNGEAWRDRFVILLVAGPVQPVFFVGAISNERVFPERGIVTASSGNQLQTIDGMLAVDYLQTIGLPKGEDGSIQGINSFPIIVYYGDGTTAARAMFATTPEGYAVCGGNVPVGATLGIGYFNPDEIKTTTEETLKQALASEDWAAVLIYSCVGRFFAQGYDPQAEFSRVLQSMEGTGIAYMAAYSGGELCPVCDQMGETQNRNHNNSFIICGLKER